MMQEIGFWDYTCPQHGSLERYTRQDWDVLLEDMTASSHLNLPEWGFEDLRLARLRLMEMTNEYHLAKVGK